MDQPTSDLSNKVWCVSWSQEKTMGLQFHEQRRQFIHFLPAVPNKLLCLAHCKYLINYGCMNK